MQAITIEIPREIAAQLRLPPKRAKRMVTEELVIRLCEQEIITAGQGAKLLNMERLHFERFLAENEIPIHGSPDELIDDINNLERVL